MTYEDTWLRVHPEDLAAHINQTSALKAQLAACEQAATKADERWAEETSIITTTLMSVRRAIQEATGCDHGWLHSDEFIAKRVKTLWRMAGEPLEPEAVAEQHAFRDATERLRNDVAEQFAVNVPKGAVVAPGSTVKIVGAGGGFPGYEENAYAALQGLADKSVTATFSERVDARYATTPEGRADDVQGPALVEPEATGQMAPVEPPDEWCGENIGPDGAVCAQRVIDGVCPDHGEVGPERAAQDTNEVTW